MRRLPPPFNAPHPEDGPALDQIFLRVPNPSKHPKMRAFSLFTLAAAVQGAFVQQHVVYDADSVHSYSNPSKGCSCLQHTKLTRAVAEGYYTKETLEGFMAGAVDYARKNHVAGEHLIKRQVNGTVSQIYKGNVISLADGQESNTYEVVATDDKGKIIFVGSAADAAKLPGAATAKLNDWTGKTIMPGLWDPHNHFFSTGLGYADPNNLLCYYPKIKTIEELNTELKTQATKLDAAGVPPNKTSIFGFGWDCTYLTL